MMSTKSHATINTTYVVNSKIRKPTTYALGYISEAQDEDLITFKLDEPLYLIKTPIDYSVTHEQSSQMVGP